MRDGKREEEKAVAAWHAEEIDAVLAALETKRTGLTDDAAAERLAANGPNAFSEQKPPGLIARIASQLVSPFSLVLLGAFAVTLALGEYLDAGVVAFALAIAVGVGVLQEGRASRAFATLARSQSPTATVFRDGARRLVEARTLVVGDMVALEAGARVPADCYLLEAQSLTVNESALTGEWLAVEKRPGAVAVGTPFSERSSMAWMGTYVTAGYGLGVVVATGDRTETGKIARDLSTIADAKTPLQREMVRVSRVMLGLIMVVIAVIFVGGIALGQPLAEVLLTSVALAVAAVPEGLPAAVTIVLAVAMESLLKRGGLVKNLLAAETLGSTTFVLTDKTGTLTEGSMETVAVTTVVGDEVRTRERETWGSESTIRELFDFALCASDAYFEEEDHGGVFTARGEPMERAILETAQHLGVPASGSGLRAQRSDYRAFDSDRRFAVGLVTGDDGSQLCFNGAPEQLLASATAVHTAGGAAPMDAGLRREFELAIDERTARGERLIAVAYKRTRAAEIADIADDTLLTETVLVGLLAFHDPVREGVREAIAGVRRAGARVVLVTGDNPNTARSVARATGIVPQNAADVPVLLGSDLTDMDDRAVVGALNRVAIFARVLPREKMRLAQALRARGEVVAMTGDGVNDASALRAADIGVAIGSGTEVAKEAADLVLVNDSFTIIYAAIEEGRRVVTNLRKIVGYLLTTSVSEVALVGTALALGAPLPILPAQILWANVIEEGLMSVAFAFEPGEKRAMEGARRSRRILSGRMFAFVALAASIMGALLIFLYLYLRAQGAPIEEIRSTMFLAVAVDSLFIAFSFRTLEIPIWRAGFRGNWFFLASFTVSLGLLFVVLAVPFFRTLLSYESLPLRDILLVIGYGFATLVAIEIGKWVFFERRAVRGV